MDKITLFALAAAFPTNHELLTTLCLATPQPITAVEMLLGIYDDPEIPQCITPKYYNDRQYTFVSFDALASDQVNYTYEDTNRHHFKTEEEAQTYSATGKTGGNGQYSYSEEYPFKGSHTQTRERSMTLKEWLEGTPVEIHGECALAE